MSYIIRRTHVVIYELDPRQRLHETRVELIESCVVVVDQQRVVNQAICVEVDVDSIDVAVLYPVEIPIVDPLPYEPLVISDRTADAPREPVTFIYVLLVESDIYVVVPGEDVTTMESAEEGSVKKPVSELPVL